MTMESDVLIPIPGKPLMVWNLMVCIDINSYRYSLFGTESDSNPTMQVQTDQPPTNWWLVCVCSPSIIVDLAMGLSFQISSRDFRGTIDWTYRKPVVIVVIHYQDYMLSSYQSAVWFQTRSTPQEINFTCPWRKIDVSRHQIWAEIVQDLGANKHMRQPRFLVFSVPLPQSKFRIHQPIVSAPKERFRTLRERFDWRFSTI